MPLCARTCTGVQVRLVTRPIVRVYGCTGVTSPPRGTGTSVLTAFGIADANRHAWQTVFCNGVRWVSGRRLLSHEGTTTLLRVLACCHTRLSVPPCTICPWPSSSSVSASQSSSTPHTRCRRRHKSTMTHPSRDRLLLGPECTSIIVGGVGDDGEGDRL